MVKMNIWISISLPNFMLTVLSTINLDLDNGHGQNHDYLTTEYGYFMTSAIDFSGREGHVTKMSRV